MPDKQIIFGPDGSRVVPQPSSDEGVVADGQITFAPAPSGQQGRGKRLSRAQWAGIFACIAISIAIIGSIIAGAQLNSVSLFIDPSKFVTPTPAESDHGTKGSSLATPNARSSDTDANAANDHSLDADLCRLDRDDHTRVDAKTRAYCRKLGITIS